MFRLRRRRKFLLNVLYPVIAEDMLVVLVSVQGRTVVLVFEPTHMIGVEGECGHIDLYSEERVECPRRG